MKGFAMSERRASRLVELDCSSCRGEPQADHHGICGKSCRNWRGRNRVTDIGICMRCYVSAGKSPRG
jgi:hypothetical protein